jgi:hypothetical protein
LNDFLQYTVGASANAGHNGISVGGEVEHNLTAFTKSDVGAAYSANGITFTAKTAKALKEASFGYHHAVLPKTSVAAIAGYAFEKKDKSFKFGLSQEIDGTSSIRAAFATGPAGTTISALYSSLLSSHSKLSLSSVIDVKQLSGGNHKCGIKLELGDL